MTDNMKIMNTVMEILKRVTTGMVVDALAISGIQGGITGIRPARGFEDSKIIGPAMTVLFAPARPDNPKLNNYRVIRESKPGSVLVIDGKGIEGHFSGDNQAACAKIRQGYCRLPSGGDAAILHCFRHKKQTGGIQTDSL